MDLQYQDKVERAEELTSSGEKHSESRKTKFRSRVESPDVKVKNNKKKYALGDAKYPTQKSAEVAILASLGRTSSITGVGTNAVLKELKENFFKELSSSDLVALYPLSQKNVVDSAIKFAKKKSRPTGRGRASWQFRLPHRSMANLRKGQETSRERKVCLGAEVHFPH